MMGVGNLSDQITLSERDGYEYSKLSIEVKKLREDLQEKEDKLLICTTENEILKRYAYN